MNETSKLIIDENKFIEYTKWYIRNYWNDIKKDIEKYGICTIWSYPEKINYYTSTLTIEQIKLGKNRDWLRSIFKKSHLLPQKVFDVVKIWNNTLNEFIHEIEKKEIVDNYVIEYMTIEIDERMKPISKTYIENEYIGINNEINFYTEEDNKILFTNNGIKIRIHHIET